MDETEVIDVTTEIIGERREEYRAGVESGLRQGAQRVLQSDALMQISLSLQVSRAIADAALEVGTQRERLLQHWKVEAQWWREEHDKIHREYCEFVKQVARMVGK
jgi:hypothetical protein